MDNIFTNIEKIRIKNSIEKILHVPGNYRGGILEFAIVFDYDIDKYLLKKSANELITLLKQTDNVFINARVNTIKWINDSNIIKEISAMGLIQMGKIFDDYDNYCSLNKSNKTFDRMTLELKKFYARSKIIIHITNDNYKIINKTDVDNNMVPFLGKKYMKIIV